MSPGLDHLWAGWRSSYISQATAAAEGRADGAEPCVLCGLIAPGGDDRERRVVWRGRLAAAVLNAYPYTSGHLMVLPTRHVGQLEDLSGDEAGELWDGVRQAVAAIKGAYRPGGINLGANLGRAAGAGVPDHLHVHALPRWGGDTSFMTTVADARVLPEPLDETWSKLREAWPR
ncbi:MAG TPA: HIT domain-containing protein [Acidimicrobiales bacterium]|nr:HIT domain-containing protein [Acidimicrobiales bacterium]